MSTEWVVSIEAKAPGRSPEYVEAQVTIPLEGALYNLAGVVRLMSRSSEETCAIEVSFAGLPTEAQVKSVAEVVQSQLAHLALKLPAPTIAIEERRVQ
jgi:multidrug efflux pump subunit AcrB